MQCGLIERRRRVVHDVHVRIMFFAHLREVSGVVSAEMDADAVDAARLWELLETRWPGLSAHRGAVRLARNGSYAADGEVFRKSDEVALIPPVSGG